MVENLANFMVFKVKDTGEKEQIEITEEQFSKQNGSPLLSEREVVLIVKESIRRIYIWKGIASSVRKKFIGSRAASELQKELMTNGNFHRCKIVSVDQGDEHQEFLDNFNLERSESKQLLEKRERIQRERTEKYLNAQISRSPSASGSYPPKMSQLKKTPKERTKWSRKVRREQEDNRQKVLETLLQKKVPEGYIRKHFILGDIELYGMIEKKAQLFDEDIERQEWDPIKTFPKEMIELKNYCFRIHIDTETNKIKSIEVLKDMSRIDAKQQPQEYKFSYWTVSKLRKYCKDHDIEVPSGALKDEIISLVKEYANSN